MGDIAVYILLDTALIKIFPDKRWVYWPDVYFLGAGLVEDDFRCHPCHSASKTHDGALLIPLPTRPKIAYFDDFIGRN